MRTTKLTLNGILVAVIIFAALGFFITVKMTKLAQRFPVNSIHYIEDTDFSVRYSSLKPDGIYKGDENTGVLMLEGTYGFDWGCSLEGNCIYVNEYKTTALGIITCNLVKINIDSFEKETVMENTVLRGKCASGELVCTGDGTMESNFPETNSLYRFYNMAGKAENDGKVIYLNPENARTVYTVTDVKDLNDNFDARFVNRSLEEVMK